jgi:hypothetical protein
MAKRRGIVASNVCALRRHCITSFGEPLAVPLAPLGLLPEAAPVAEMPANAPTLGLTQTEACARTEAETSTPAPRQVERFSWPLLPQRGLESPHEAATDSKAAALALAPALPLTVSLEVPLKTPLLDRTTLGRFSALSASWITRSRFWGEGA